MAQTSSMSRGKSRGGGMVTSYGLSHFTLVKGLPLLVSRYVRPGLP